MTKNTLTIKKPSAPVVDAFSIDATEQLTGEFRDDAVNLKVKRLHKDAVVPTFATPGSACFDIHGIEDFTLAERNEPFGQGRVVRTGLAFAVPAGFVLSVYSRSGMGFKDGVRLGNSVGVVDADFRGELKIKLHNDGTSAYVGRKGDRIAQGRLEPVIPTALVEVDELDETERGAGGFGSSGR